MQSLNINDMRATAGGRSKFFFRYFLLFALLIFCIFQFNIYNIYGFSIYPDEFGYWASAAEVLGYDWSATVALGSYYSYGYGMILTGLLWIFHDSVMAYRAAIAVNMLLQCGSIVILWKIFKRLHQTDGSKKRKMQVVLAVGVAVFYPPWLFCVEMTMAEALLMFLYVLICYQIILFVEKPNIIGAVLLALSLIYIYFVHMRTIAVVIAAVLTFFLYAWKTPSVRKKLAILFVIMVVGVVWGQWIKGKVTATVYAATDSELLSVNDYSGRLGALKNLFSIQGIKEIFFSSVGKLYYLVMASFGLFIPAIYTCVKNIWKMLQSFCLKKENKECNGYIYLFCLLAMMGQFVIIAISTMFPGRLDIIIYGRYNEYLLPVFIGIGLITVCESSHKLRIFILNVVISAILFMITFRYALHSGLTIMLGFFAPGISYLSNDWNYDIKTEFLKAYFFGIFLMTCVMICIYIGKRFRKYIYVMGAILIMEILLVFCLKGKYTKPFNDKNYYNLMISQYMAEYDKPISYLYGGGYTFIDLIQFDMRDRKINIIMEKDLESQQEGILPDQGFLIVDQECEYLEEIEERYKKCIESQSFILFLAK